MPEQNKIDQISDGIDAAIIDALTNGQKVVTGYNEDGTARMDTVSPTPAMITAAIKRLQQLGVSKLVAPDNPLHAAIRKAQEGIKFNGKPIPPLSDAPDAATA